MLKAANRTVRVVFLVVFIGTCYLVWSTYNNMYKAFEEGGDVRTALDILLKIENVRAHVHAIESGQRGFTISADEKFLKSYESGLISIRKDTLFLKKNNEMIT